VFNGKVARALPILVALLLVRFVATEAVYQRAKWKGASLSFPAGLGLRIIVGLGIPFFLYATYETAMLARQNGEWWLPGLFAVFALGLVSYMPPEIRVNKMGIAAITLFGLRKRSLGWEGASAGYSAGRHEVLVIGADGTCITHSQYHVGQAQFLGELERHHVPIQGR
jgi:hypothetical protein